MLEYITEQRHGEYGFDREWLKDIRKMGYEPLQPGDTSKPIIHLGLVPMRMADRSRSDRMIMGSAGKTIVDVNSSMTDRCLFFEN